MPGLQPVSRLVISRPYPSHRILSRDGRFFTQNLELPRFDGHLMIVSYGTREESI
jgi:hypothetical protein